MIKSENFNQTWEQRINSDLNQALLQPLQV